MPTITAANQFAPSTGAVCNDPADFSYYVRQLQLHRRAVDLEQAEIDRITAQGFLYRLRHALALLVHRRTKRRLIDKAISLHQSLTEYNAKRVRPYPIQPIPAEWLVSTLIL